MSRALARLAAILTTAALAGCAALPPKVAPIARAPAAPPPPPAPPPKVVRVYVPKPVKCVPEDLGPPPAYPDNDAALRDAGGAADRYQLLAAGRILREQRLARLEEVIRRCRNASR